MSRVEENEKLQEWFNDQIAKDCNYNSDMFIDAGIVFSEIAEQYKNDELPTVIHLYD